MRSGDQAMNHYQYGEGTLILSCSENWEGSPSWLLHSCDWAKELNSFFWLAEITKFLNHSGQNHPFISCLNIWQNCRNNAMIKKLLRSWISCSLQSTLYVSTDDPKSKCLKPLYPHCALLHTNISVLWSGSGIKSFGSYIIFDLLQGTRLISNSSICKSSQKSTYIWSSESFEI